MAPKNKFGIRILAWLTLGLLALWGAVGCSSLPPTALGLLCNPALGSSKPQCWGDGIKCHNNYCRAVSTQSLNAACDENCTNDQDCRGRWHCGGKTVCDANLKECVSPKCDTCVTDADCEFNANCADQNKTVCKDNACVVDGPPTCPTSCGGETNCAACGEGYTCTNGKCEAGKCSTTTCGKDKRCCTGFVCQLALCRPEKPTRCDIQCTTNNDCSRNLACRNEGKITCGKGGTCTQRQSFQLSCKTNGGNCPTIDGKALACGTTEKKPSYNVCTRNCTTDADCPSSQGVSMSCLPEPGSSQKKCLITCGTKASLDDSRCAPYGLKCCAPPDGQGGDGAVCFYNVNGCPPSKPPNP